MTTMQDYLHNPSDYIWKYKELCVNALKDDNSCLDIPRITISLHDTNLHNMLMAKYALTSFVFPEQLKILKLPKIYGWCTDHDKTSKITLNDGLEELYVENIDIFGLIRYFPLSLEKIVVNDEHMTLKLDKYNKMIPYGCIISYVK